MPWVRMHGIKDYWDMVRILDDYPGIKQTFNFAPSLLEQIDDYLAGNATDAGGGERRYGLPAGQSVAGQARRDDYAGERGGRG